MLVYASAYCLASIGYLTWKPSQSSAASSSLAAMIDAKTRSSAVQIA